MTPDEIQETLRKAYFASLMKFYMHTTMLHGGDVSIESLDSFLKYAAEHPGGTAAQSAEILNDFLTAVGNEEGKRKIVADTRELMDRSDNDSAPERRSAGGCLSIVFVLGVPTLAHLLGTVL
jgi:hypothetical protein